MPPASSTKRTRKKHSSVWMFFKHVSPRICKCLICNKSLNYSHDGSTSNMLHHMDRHHPKELKERALKKGIVLSEDERSVQSKDQTFMTLNDCEIDSFTDVDTHHLHPDKFTENTKENMPLSRDDGNDIPRLCSGVESVDQASPGECHIGTISDNAMLPRSKWGRIRFNVSAVWFFVQKISPRLHRCLICHKLLKNNRWSTTNLLRHVKGQHPKEFEERMKRKQNNSKELGYNSQCLDTSDKTSDMTIPSRLPTINSRAKQKRTNASTAWLFVKKVTPLLYRCVICNKPFSYTKWTSTSNFLKHVRNSHPKQFEEGLMNKTDFVKDSETERDVQCSNGDDEFSYQTVSLEGNDADMVAGVQPSCTLVRKNNVSNMQHFVKKMASLGDSMCKCIICNKSLPFKMSRIVKHVEQHHPNKFQEKLHGTNNISEDIGNDLPSLKSGGEIQDMFMAKTANKSDENEITDMPPCVKAVKKRKNVSAVWNFVKRISPRECRCIICNKLIQHKKDGSTSNLLKHLRCCHQRELKEIPEVTVRNVQSLNADGESSDQIIISSSESHHGNATHCLSSDVDVEDQFIMSLSANVEGKSNNTPMSVQTLQMSANVEEKSTDTPPSVQTLRMSANVEGKSNNTPPSVQTLRMSANVEGKSTDTPPSDKPLHKRKNGSSVWVFVKKISPSLCRCLICNKLLSYGKRTSTSNLLWHVQRWHPEEFKDGMTNKLNTMRDNEKMSHSSDTDFEPVDQAMASQKKSDKDNYTSTTCPISDRVVQNRINASAAWIFIKRVGPSLCRCVICNRPFSYSKGRSTTALLKHVKHCHPEEFKEGVKNKQNTVKDIDKMSHSSDTDVEPVDQAMASPNKSVKDKFITWPISDKIVKNRNNDSGAWIFMKRVSSSLCRCVICKKLFSCSSTTTLLRHVRVCHPEKFKELKDQKKTARNIHQDVQCSKRDSESWDQTLLPKQYDIKNADDAVILPKTNLGNVRSNISVVWFLMKKISPTQCQCLSCDQLLTMRSGSTSNLIRHLKICNHQEKIKEIRENHREKIKEMCENHQEKIKEMCEYKTNSEKQLLCSDVDRPLDQIMTCSNVNDEDVSETVRTPKACKKVANDNCNSSLLIQLIADNYLPSQLLNSENFTKVLKQQYRAIHSQEEIDNLISLQYGQSKSDLQDELSETSHVSLSLEFWTYRERNRYMSISVHFVSKQWKIRSVTLKTILLPQNFNSADTIEEISKLLDEWQITDTVTCIVTDTSQDFGASLSTLPIHHWKCFAQVLDSIVVNAMKLATGVQGVIQKVRDIVQYFHHSSDATNKLLIAQQLNTEDVTNGLSLLTDTPTNWISTFLMVQRFMQLQIEIVQALNDLQLENMQFSTNEVDTLNNYVNALEPFYMAAIDMSNDGFCPLSKTIPLLSILQSMLSTLIQANPGSPLTEYDSTFELVEQLQTQVTHCMTTFGDKRHKLSGTATLLDPRFKHLMLQDVGLRQYMKDQLLQLMLSKESSDASNDPASGDDQNKVTNRSSIPTRDKNGSFRSQFFDSLAEARDETSSREIMLSEIQQYFVDAPITRTEDPLSWWKKHKSEYPTMSKLARQFLNIPATSVPPKQIFEEEVKLHMARRDDLDEKYIDALLLIRSYGNPMNS